MPHIFEVFTLVPPSIGPIEFSKAMYLILIPSADEAVSVAPCILPLAVHTVVFKVTFVIASVREVQVTKAKQFAVLESTLVLLAVFSFFLALAILKFHLPVTFVPSTAAFDLCTISMSLILKQLTDIYVSVRMVKNTFSFGKVVLELANVL